MLTPYPVDVATGQSTNSDAEYYCCAALTAPSTITSHMQTGDILISINDESLISDSNQSTKSGGPEAFFDQITNAIKHAKCPRVVRLLRPFATPTSAVYDIELNVAEASFLFSDSHKVLSSEVPKLTVGNLTLAQPSTAITGNFFDVIFPNQSSLGIRIFPYKLVDSHTRAARVTLGLPLDDGKVAVENGIQIVESDSERVASANLIKKVKSSSEIGELSSAGSKGTTTST